MQGSVVHSAIPIGLVVPIQVTLCKSVTLHLYCWYLPLAQNNTLEGENFESTRNGSFTFIVSSVRFLQMVVCNGLNTPATQKINILSNLFVPPNISCMHLVGMLLHLVGISR